MTILFPLEDKKCTLDHQEVILWSVMVIKSAGHILQVMEMVLIMIEAMDMMSES